MKTIFCVISLFLFLQNNLCAQTPELSQFQNYISGFVPDNKKSETVGSRYFNKEWVSGTVTTIDDNVYNLPHLKFMYDKILCTLYTSEDTIKVFELDKPKIKSFTLFIPSDNFSGALTNIDFERVNVINPSTFFNPIVKSNQYSFYKLIKTTFEKAEYSTNGIFETGNKNNTYTDSYEYYIVLPGGKEFRKIDLKKKSIKQALEKETTKVDNYFNSYKSERVDESFVKNLILFLNN